MATARPDVLLRAPLHLLTHAAADAARAAGAVIVDPKSAIDWNDIAGADKTLLARATATESGAKFYAQSASAFVEMFAGLGAARIRKLFAEARKNAPSIIFIDELDAVGAARTGSSFNR